MYYFSGVLEKITSRPLCRCVVNYFKTFCANQQMTKALFARSFLLLLLLHFLLPRVTLSLCLSLLRERHARTHAKKRERWTTTTTTTIRSISSSAWTR